MNYTQVQINKVDNGWVVNTTKVLFGDQRPEQTVTIYATFDEVLAFLGKAA